MEESIEACVCGVHRLLVFSAFLMAGAFATYTMPSFFFFFLHDSPLLRNGKRIFCCTPSCLVVVYDSSHADDFKFVAS